MVSLPRSIYFICFASQTAEEVNFSANGITSEGLKAFDGVLQSNAALKCLNLSGNNIGDEGAKVKFDVWTSIRKEIFYFIFFL